MNISVYGFIQIWTVLLTVQAQTYLGWDNVNTSISKNFAKSASMGGLGI
jgi:hypothetical protein